MLPSQVSAPDIENARVAVALVAVGIVLFWRFMLRVVLVIIAVAVVVGVFVLIESMHL